MSIAADAPRSTCVGLRAEEEKEVVEDTSRALALPLSPEPEPEAPAWNPRQPPPAATPTTPRSVAARDMPRVSGGGGGWSWKLGTLLRRRQHTARRWVSEICFGSGISAR